MLEKINKELLKSYYAKLNAIELMLNYAGTKQGNTDIFQSLGFYIILIYKDMWDLIAYYGIVSMYQRAR